MRSHPVGLDVWFFGPTLHRPAINPACSATEASQNLETLDKASIHIILSKQRTTKMLIRLRGCAGWSAPLLFAYGIRHIFAWSSPFMMITHGICLVQRQSIECFVYMGIPGKKKPHTFCPNRTHLINRMIILRVKVSTSRQYGNPLG